jgi:hypothetical protein
MNERIKELAKQASIHLDDNGDIIWSKTRYNSEVEKFAMLIIRECMDECGDITSARNIEEHFGIEIVWD